jgi:hypothetical protein
MDHVKQSLYSNRVNVPMHQERLDLTLNLSDTCGARWADVIIGRNLY